MGSTMFVESWLDHTKYPAEKVYLDQDLVLYKGLKTKKGILRTLFMPHLAILGLIKRFFNKQAWKDFKDTVSKYKLKVPEDASKGWIQGGAFVFKGSTSVFQHYERTPGDYPTWEKVMVTATNAQTKA
eukprot:gene608-2034_t